MAFQPQQDVALHPLTTLGVGGRAEYWARVTDPDQLQAAYAWAAQRGVPVTVLGAGSNSLISEHGVAGLVIHNAIGGVWWQRQPGEQVSVTAGAGEAWDDVVIEAVQRDLWGIENLAAIPGSVGAAPVQNIGAYGAELADTLTEVQVFDTHTGEVFDMPAPACRFGYRTSIFKQQPERYVICYVTLLLQQHGSPQLTYDDLQTYFADVSPEALQPHDVAAAVRDIRAQKFPAVPHVGTAGSFFQNVHLSAENGHALQTQHPDAPLRPHGDGYKLSAAWCIERAGYPRGFTQGQVGLWRDHALVVVTYPGATARELEAFVQQVQEHVARTVGVTLTREVVSLA